jgi:hypothetical protein
MRAFASVAVVALLVGCGGSSKTPSVPPATTVTVGALGGVIQIPNGPSLAIVPDALAADTAITVTPRTSTVSGALSTVYDFQPAGLTFSRPATLSIPVDPSLTEASLMVTFADSTTQSLPALVDNGLASAQVTQLSSGYAAASRHGTRTVSGTFTTVYWADDGSKTTRAGSLGPVQTVTAAWVPAGSNYRRIAASTAPLPLGGFAIDGVPEGPYFLEVDTTFQGSATSAAGTTFALYELTTSTPDLSVVAAARADVETETTTAKVTLALSGLTPWTRPPAGFNGDQVIIAGSQNSLYGRPLNTIGAPASGATTFSGSFDWNDMSTAFAIGLPDASKGDVEFLYQRSTTSIGSGATLGSAHVATRFAKLTDLTLHDGGSANLTVTLADAPQTGSLRANLRNSKWATLITDSNPAMVAQGGQGVSLLAIPHSLDFPDQPGLTAGTSLAYIQGPPLTDADYGTIAYGQFLGAEWKEVRYVSYFASANVPQPGSTELVPASAFFTSFEAMPADDEIVPVLGPPRSPTIQGLDAFAAQSGVGLRPTISWKPPRLGSATSYTVSLFPTDTADGSVSITVYGVTSVQIPAGILKAGKMYSAVITANSAPWDSLDRPVFRLGVPSSSADCATAAFTP